jgi:hypothetical protein
MRVVSYYQHCNNWGDQLVSDEIRKSVGDAFFSLFNNNAVAADIM